MEGKMKRNKLFLVVVACALLIFCAVAAVIVNAADTA